MPPSGKMTREDGDNRLHSFNITKRHITWTAAIISLFVAVTVVAVTRCTPARLNFWTSSYLYWLLNL